MTTKIQKILSFLLALTVVFCAASAAYAVETNLETDAAEYLYYGELSEGWNTIWEDDWQEKIIKNLYVYYSFSIPESGYYRLNYGTPHTDMYAEIYGEYNYKETLFQSYAVGKIYYLEKGNYKLTVDVYYSDVDVSIFAEYLGERITDISFNYDQVLDYDFYWYNFYSDEITEFNSTADATLTFSSGKTYKFDDGTLYGTIDSEYKDGVNNVKIYFLEQYIPTTATVFPASHYISDVEINNLEYYYDKNLEYFNYVDYVLPYGETIKFTFTDGSVQYIDCDYYMYITLPNGQDYEIDVSVFYDHYFSLLNGGNCCMEIRMGSNYLKEYYFDGTKVSFKENIDSLFEQTKHHFDEMICNLTLAVKNKEETAIYLENSFIELFEISIILFDFVYYYTSLSFV